MKTPWGWELDLGSVVAWAALLLSQLPPLRELIRGKKVEIEVAEEARLAHFNGAFTFALWLQLHNSGGRSATVGEVVCTLKDPRGTHTFTGKVHWLTDKLGSGNEVSVPFGSLRLERGRGWSGYVQFWDGGRHGKAWQRKVKELTSKIRDDLKPKLDAERARAATEAREMELVTLEDGLLAQVTAFVNESLIVDIGEYTLCVQAKELSSGATLASATYFLTLFESDMKDLKADVDEYKYGAGWTHAAVATKWLSVNVRASQ